MDRQLNTRSTTIWLCCNIHVVDKVKYSFATSYPSLSALKHYRIFLSKHSACLSCAVPSGKRDWGSMLDKHFSRSPLCSRFQVYSPRWSLAHRLLVACSSDWLFCAPMVACSCLSSEAFLGIQCFSYFFYSCPLLCRSFAPISVPQRVLLTLHHFALSCCRSPISSLPGIGLYGPSSFGRSR